jgi:hypothetical protein
VSVISSIFVSCKTLQCKGDLNYNNSCVKHGHILAVSDKLRLMLLPYRCHVFKHENMLKPHAILVWNCMFDLSHVLLPRSVYTDSQIFFFLLLCLLAATELFLLWISISASGIWTKIAQKKSVLLEPWALHWPQLRPCQAADHLLCFQCWALARRSLDERFPARPFPVRAMMIEDL